MSDKTPIEWTDSTWNIVTGCSVVSPGCTNCYAMKLAGTRLQNHPSRAGLTQDSKAGPVWTGEVRLNEEWLDQPLRWKKPRKIFVCAHGDLFHESVPDEWIDRVFAVMALTSRHAYQVLTTRPERMRNYILRLSRNIQPLETHARDLGYTFHFQGLSTLPWPIPNIWLGVSVEDQKRADERIPVLLNTPAAIRFISAEPLLGPIDIRSFVGHHVTHGACVKCGVYHPATLLNGCDYQNLDEPIDWVIVGGESGPGARPMHPDWARSLRDQCQAAGVAYLFKQWGSWKPMEVGESQGGNTDFVLRDPADKRKPMSGCFHMPHAVDACITNPEYGWRYPVRNVGKKAAGRLLDGRTWDEFPEAA